MARFGTPLRSTRGGLDRSNARTAPRRNDYELREEDGEYVLSVELPGFGTDDITVTWDDGLLNVAAERDDERRGRRTYHQRFRLPKRIDDDAISASYENGVLEVRLPVRTPPNVQGKRIEVSD